MHARHCPTADRHRRHQHRHPAPSDRRFNERELRWAALDNWTFSLDFEAPSALLRHPSVLLHFSALDTVAAVELNGALVGSATNAHRPHSWDVTQLLREGNNTLSISLLSAPAYAEQHAAAYPNSVPATQHVGALPHYNFIRKAASDFGWCVWGGVSACCSSWLRVPVHYPRLECPTAFSPLLPPLPHALPSKRSLPPAPAGTGAQRLHQLPWLELWSFGGAAQLC